MENINSIFFKNSFASYPDKTKKPTMSKYKDILNKKSSDTSQYLDILYSDKIYETSEKVNLTELLKMHLPLRNKFFIF